MGRWFGYRDNYEDLCKLFTSNNLISKFRKFYSQKENFMRQILNLDSGKYTPRQVGMYIVKYQGVNPTAKNKMRNGEEIFIKLIFDSDHIQELDIPTSDRKSNKEVIQNFLEIVENQKIKGEYFENQQKWILWNDVPSEIIIEEFMDKYNESKDQIHDDSTLGEQKLYIRELNKYGELTNWTVGFYLGGSVSNTNDQLSINGHDIKFKAMKRSRRYGAHSKGDDDTWDGKLDTLKSEKEGEKTYKIGALTDLTAEKMDLVYRDSIAKVKPNTELSKFNQLLEGDNSKKPPVRTYLRESRDPKRGFLMIFPVFPRSSNETGENLPPYFAYATSYPKSEFLNENPKNIEKIFGEERKIVNKVGADKIKRSGYKTA